MRRHFIVKPLKIRRKQWVIFSGITIILAALIIGPVAVSRRVKMSEKPLKVDVMIRVNGTIHHQSENNITYLKSDKGLYYILLGNQVRNLLNNINESATVFGNVVVSNSVIEGEDDAQIDGNPVRMRINVVSFDFYKKNKNISNLQNSQHIHM
jgi:hypothetical protein